MKKKLLSIEKYLEILLGVKGSIISFSKSCGPAMAIYNSNIVINDEVIWYGDIDLETSRYTLVRLADFYKCDIDVYGEDIRIWPFEKGNKKKLQKEKIDNSTPIFTTRLPNFFAGKKYIDVLYENKLIKSNNIRDRAIMLGFLTPNGTEWSYLNKIYYNSIHYLYRIIRNLCNIFIIRPYKISCIREEGFFKKIVKFFKSIFNEFYYIGKALKNKEWTFYGLFLDV